MTHVPTRRKVLVLSAAVLVAACMSEQASAFDVDGKRIELIVPFGEGGGTDTYARFMAPKLHEALPGDSTLIIRNIPGAGSIAGANQFEERAKPDGMTLLAVSQSTILNYVLNDPRVKFDPSKWVPILVSPLGNVAYVHQKTGIEEPYATADKIKTLRDQELILGANGPTSADISNLVGYDMLQIPLKPVFGLNRGKSRQAFERGEFTLNTDSTAAFRKNAKSLIESGMGIPFTVQGYLNAEGDMIEDPGNPDIPTVAEAYEMVNGKRPSGPQFEAYKTLISVSVMTSKALVLPAGTPQEIVDFYREAMAKVIADPGWEKESERFLGGYPTLLGREATAALKSATTMDTETKKWLFDWLDETYDVKRQM
ncbi:MAG: hypothetical protein WD270_11025 [Acetobacterales bacterium]